MAKKSSLKIKCHSLNSELPCGYCQVPLSEMGWEWLSPGTWLSSPPCPDNRHFGARPWTRPGAGIQRADRSSLCLRLAGPEREVGSEASHHPPVAVRVQRREYWLNGPSPSSLPSSCPQVIPNDPKSPVLPDLQLSLLLHCPYPPPALGPSS